jgi:tRNA (Thr-GGU) A37 N-methylase
LAIVQSCFPEKFGTPRQASLAPSTRGRVVFRPDIDAECIEGIEEFSHVKESQAFIFLIFFLHRYGLFLCLTRMMDREGKDGHLKAR